MFVVLFLGEIPSSEISGSKDKDTVRFFLMTQCWALGCLSSPSLPSSQLVLFFLGVSPRFSDNHPRFITLLFLYEARKQQPFSWWTNTEDSLGPMWGGATVWLFTVSRALGISVWVGPKTPSYSQSSWTQIPPGPSRSIRSLSWQHCLFLSYLLLGGRFLSQMPDDLHQPANWAAKPKCFPKAFWESREKSKHDCKLWHLF